MALADIKEKIIAEAEQERKSLLKEAEENKKNLLDEAEKKALELKEQIEEKLAKEAPLVEKRREAVANLDVQKLMLGAKQKLIERAFQKSAEHLTSLSYDEYRRFMGNLLEKAVETGGEDLLLGEDETSLDRSWVDDFNGRTGHHLNLYEEKTSRGKRGFILRNGRIETNCTVEMLIRSLRGDLETNVAERLFADV